MPKHGCFSAEDLPPEEAFDKQTAGAEQGAVAVAEVEVWGFVPELLVPMEQVGQQAEQAEFVFVFAGPYSCPVPISLKLQRGLFKD